MTLFLFPIPWPWLCRVSTKQSLHFNVFYRHHQLQLTLDVGAKTSIMEASAARSIDGHIVKPSQEPYQQMRLLLSLLLGRPTSLFQELANA